MQQLKKAIKGVLEKTRNRIAPMQLSGEAKIGAKPNSVSQHGARILFSPRPSVEMDSGSHGSDVHSLKAEDGRALRS